MIEIRSWIFVKLKRIGEKREVTMYSSYKSTIKNLENLKRTTRDPTTLNTQCVGSDVLWDRVMLLNLYQCIALLCCVTSLYYIYITYARPSLINCLHKHIEAVRA